MKKIAASILVLFLIFSAVSGFCDDDTSGKPFSCPLTSAMIESSAKDVVTDDTQRAILTICLLLDLGTEAEKDFMSENFGAVVLNDSYIASDGQFLIFSGFSSGKLVSIFYSPEGKLAMYTIRDTDLTDEYMALLVKTTSEHYEYCYKNEVTDLIMVVNAISEALNNN